MKRVLYLALLIAFATAAHSQASYQEAIKEGKTLAQKYIDKKEASAITIALVDGKQIIWSQSFGFIDPATGEVVSDSTLFGIGSVSKILATIAVMKLVEQGLIDLDTPVVKYLPNFSMRSPEFKKITVRMLLNHSAGFPGTDYRNALIRTPYPDYANQVLRTLSMARLKTPPGFMNVYCNDCFTLIEPLITAKTGKSYVQFVQDEIFTPLAMTNTRYAVSHFPDKSYAKAYTNGILQPQEFVNTLASGGAYSTANDLAKIAMLFLNSGTVGETRILSPASVAEMAKDQTLGRFNPVHNNSFAYGLGWDTVVQPGLVAVGFDGWAKGGDSTDYGAMMMVSPKAQLGVVVIAASGFGSEKAKIIAERVLLRAMAENKLISNFPEPLPTPGIVPEIANSNYKEPDKTYAMFDLVLNFQKQTDGTQITTIFSGQDWQPIGKLQKQGEWWVDPQLPMNSIKIVHAAPMGKDTNYIIKRSPYGNGHYLDTILFAQQLPKITKKLSPVWKARLNSTWVVVNTHPDDLSWGGLDPRLYIKELPGTTNLIAVKAPDDQKFHVVNPANSDYEATMMLNIPQLYGRDLNDLIIEKHNGNEWVSFGSYLHKPLSIIETLPLKRSSKITIGDKGYAEWRAIKSTASSRQLMINTNGHWQLFDHQFKTLKYGNGDAEITVPAGNELNYLIMFGEPGKTITVQ